MAKQMIDEANFSIELPENISTLKIKHHAVQYSVVGKPLTIYLNNSERNANLWKIPDEMPDWYSSNLEKLEINLENGKIYSGAIIEKELDGNLAEGQEYYIRYFLKTSESSGILGEVVDEIDRYLIKFKIDYIDNDASQSIEFFVPNSVYKYLLGFDISQPVMWVSNLVLEPPATNPSDPEDDPFTRFFHRLYNLIITGESSPVTGDPWQILAYSKIINRNTPRNYSEDLNPFIENDLALIKNISEPDVLNHDSLYPTKVSAIFESFV